MVYVQNKNGKPLMPCKEAKARHLLKDGKAEVINVEPFTIRITYLVENPKVQEVVVGVDTGSKKIGIAATSRGKSLYQAEIALRDNIRKKMDERRMYRINRRSRKYRYRAPRFDNRTRKEGWLPPSIQSKVNTTIKAVRRVAALLPVSKINVEIANFDTHAMQKGLKKLPCGWMYQRGELYQEENIKSFVRSRDSYVCVYCKKEGDEVDHIIPTSKGGATKVSNLVCACHECNQKKGDQTAEEYGHPKVQERAKESLKDAAHAQAGKTNLLKQLREIAPVSVTYGHITKVNRKTLGLEKSHYIDAVVIAGEGNPVMISNQWWCGRAIARGNYRLYKGNHSHILNQSKKVLFEFRQWDKVRMDDGQIGFIKGKRSTGYFCVSDIEGKIIDDSILWKKLKLLKKANSLILEKKASLLKTEAHNSSSGTSPRGFLV